MKRVRASDGIEMGAEVLANGGIVAYPTETFYGLGVDAQNRRALQRLREFKGRAAEKAFPILLSAATDLGKYCREVPYAAQILTRIYWPGALTVVLSASGLPNELKGPSRGTGFRMSAHPIALQLVKRLGRPVTTTSANPAGEPPAQTPEDVIRYFNSADLFLLDDGPTPGGLSSTVIDFCEAPEPKLIREGAIPWSEMQQVLQR